MNNEENEFIPPPPELVRQLSEQHWQAGMDEIGDRNMIVTGTMYDNHGDVSWLYYIVQRGNIIERHSVCERRNIHDIITVPNHQ